MRAWFARSSSKWPSRLFIRTTWRQALLSAYNEVVLAVLSEAGITVAEVQHAHGKAGDPLEAERLFLEMVSDGAAPNRISYNSVANAWAVAAHRAASVYKGECGRAPCRA